MTNAIAISQNLVDAGLELKAANAIAVAMDSNVNEIVATKTDLAKMEAATKADLVKVETATNFIRVEEEMKTLATKADLAKLETKVMTEIKVMSTKFESLITSNKDIKNLVYGLYALLFVIDIKMVIG